MLDKPIDQLTPEQLGRLYEEGETCDKRMFAEMRTNLQLVAGEHYVREGSKYWNRIKDNKDLTNEQRIKLTKNHIQKITKTYRNGIEACAPGVAILPAVETELQDQKVAEMHSAYWNHVKECENLEEQVSKWIKDFVEIGEVAVKIFWEPNAGNVVAYEAEMTFDEGGEAQPEMDEQGQPVQSKTPVYGGKLVFETIAGYNLKRDPGAINWKDSPYVIYAKVVSKSALRTLIDDKSLLSKLDESANREYTVFDNNTGRYRALSDQVMVKEIYFRPCPLAPEGYFYIYTESFIIASGPLPYGIFPIVHAGFDDQTGNPRCHSIIRHIRPSQIEINRAASKVAEHQVTLGDDKVYIAANTKLSQGAMLPGVRINTFTGMEPKVVPGRTGDQYLPYIVACIDEMYKLANLEEESQQLQGSGDLYTDLYRRIRYKKKFSIYGSRFERFLVQVCKTSLQIAKKCVSEHELIPAIGKNEYINVAEFKNAEDLNYQIKVEPRSDDIESQMGKQLVLNHFVQYVGAGMQRDDIGKFARLSPFLNKEKSLQDLTQKYDNITNDILALDRGQQRPPRKYDDHKYVVQALTSRMAQPDFEFLPGAIQALYQQKVEAHEQLMEQQLQALQMAEAGFIPSSGYAVACDFYTSDPNDPNRTRRVRLPSDAINWLIQKLQTQGTAVQGVNDLPGGVTQDIAAALQRQQGAGGGQQAPQQPAISPHGMPGQVNPAGGFNAQRPGPIPGQPAA